MREFFRHVPDDLGLAYVVIVHLAPDHPSALSDILGSVTKMSVHQVTDTPKLRPNCVYVIPPDRELVIRDDDVHARPFSEPRGRRAPIDMFFRSVAAGRGDGLAVVLSGAGSDGAQGVRAVKEAGGVVFVQEPSDAEYPMMPRSALATGVADFVAPVPRLVERLVEVAHSKAAVRELDLEGAEGDLRRIVAFLRSRTGHDFSSYKRATVMRRVTRRMQVTRRADLGEYARYLVENPEEAQELFGDLLISVTQFFRDPAAYRVLTEQAIGPLFEEVGEKGIRAWVVGCATGEESYSLAILMLEEADRRGLATPIQIFATDLDEGALATAREGRYPASIEADLSEALLKRWFVREGPHYRVKKEVRDCVLFASHSVLKDPPFMHIDLVSCRNLLIYLERELQRQVCTLFHYGLEPQGFLFLGSAETVDATPEVFFPVNREARLYRARPVARRSLPILSNLPPGLRPEVLEHRHRRATETRRRDPVEERGSGGAHLAALERAAPPSALVDHEHRAIDLSASAGRFLLPGAGPFSTDITTLVRPELRLDLRGALRRALEHAETTLTLPLPVAFNDHRRRVILQVAPVRQADDMPPHQALVFFLDGGPVPDVPVREAGESGDEEVRRLREEVRALEERLVASRNEHENAMQDLRIANEELQSVNEEYRSTSEELETSKEELQSMNEELQTVNSELKSKLESISTAHSDLQNLVTSTEIGTLFLDSDLRIRMLTPVVSGLFNVTEADVGRPITDFTHRLAQDGLDEQAKRVLRDLVPVEHEIGTVDGRWMMMRLRPYRTIDDRIDGVVVTFVDVTARREAEARVRESEEEYRRLFNSIDQGFCVIEMIYDEDGRATDYRFIEVNAAFERQTGLADTAGRRMRSLVPDHEEFWFETYGRIARSGKPERFEHEAETLGRYYEVYAFPLDSSGERKVGVLFNDIRARKEAEAERELLARELSHRVKNTLAVVQALARQTGGRTVDEFRDAFAGRLGALAKAHSLLLDSDWRTTDLGALVRAAMAAYDGEQAESVRIEGPPLTVEAKQSLGLSLVLHELATNALKYGALSTKGGTVRISWSEEDDGEGGRVVRFRWIERDGPKIAPPEEEGFGTQMIQRAGQYDLGGEVEMVWAADGLTCEIVFPAS